jgi:hypothetical protein
MDADFIGSVGKQARDESGKYPVNENGEEYFWLSDHGNRDGAANAVR